MKVYRYGKEPNPCYNIIIEEDDGTFKVAFVGLNSVKEQIAKEYHLNNGIVRLVFGGGSSMPYKDKDGKLCERYVLIHET
jgi:hypothetical protein